MSTTKSINLAVTVVYTPLDDVIGSESDIRTLEEAIQYVQGEIRESMERLIPHAARCSVVIGERRN